MINWGDGTIDTVAGNPSSVTHTYHRAGFTSSILAAATDDDGTFLQNDLFVPSYTRASVFRFEATTGAFLQELAIANGLDKPIEAIIGPDSRLYVSSEQSHHILRYDPATGAFIDVFVTPGHGGLSEPGGMAFGPDGHLYVASGLGDAVLRYDGNTGAFINAFVSPGSGGLDQPYGLVFGPDGHLYVASFSNHEVLRYDGHTGAFIGAFISPGSGGLDTPEQMAFGPDGNFYVASFETDHVLRYDGSTGAFIDMFVTNGLGGLDQPTGLAFGPDGHLYVGDSNHARILRYDGHTGAFIDTYVNAGSGGLTSPVLMAFSPKQQVTVNPNLPPTINLSGNAATYTENSQPIVLDVTATVNDPDSPDFATGTLTVDFAAGGSAHDRLYIRNQGPGNGNITLAGIDVHYDFGSGPVAIGTVVGGTSGSNPLDITFNANANATAVIALLRNLTYQNVSDAPSADTRIVRVIFTDGDGGTSNAATLTIHLTTTNDEPSNTGTLPTDILVTEDEASNLPLTTIDLADADAGMSNLTLTLTTSAGGTLIATSSDGVAINGSGTATLMLTGTVEALNAFVDDSTKIQYLSALNAHGDNADRITLEIADSGNTDGDGGGRIALGSIQIDITSVGDTPQVPSHTILEDMQSDAIILNRHPDDGGEVTHFRISNISGGTLFHNDGTSVINHGDFITVAEGNAGLKFTPSPNAIVTGSFDVKASEDGLSVAAQSSAATVTITITAENDRPTSISLTPNSVVEATDTSRGYPVGIFSSTDPDSDDRATYSIVGGANQAVFSIGAAASLVLTDGRLDFETQPVYDVIVRVTDSGGLTLDQTFAVSVTDLAIAITPGPLYRTKNQNSGYS